ncbi:diacylglycerol kinase family protein [Tannerella forsythia]|uniref:Diacylglycerol kinase family protein n=1 Tax=Tannerella forsythia TaxID=28112 RepID=A0A3P1XYC1_TANFO|nr:diacylglycerol kinase family protein [Tannerella forsythia]RRD62937.1 diacylglycerol kinase family protein [Tannerella forsythia]
MIKEKKKFSIRRLFRSFSYALRGVRQVIYAEQNARVHTLVLVCVVAAGIYFRLSPMEWIAVVLAAGGVFAGETFNTAIEELSDAVFPQYDERIKRVKDFSAGAVLIMAITAAIIGLVIFIPKIAECCY